MSNQIPSPPTVQNPIDRVPEEPTLDILFQRDPLELTRQDVARIVEALRAQRSKFLLEEKTKGGKKAATAANQETNKKLGLDDLDISL